VTDPIVRLMEKADIPLTRENCLMVAYLGNPPEVLGAEEEAELPEWFQVKVQKKNKADEDSFYPA
jgi:hypothetical protein